MVFLIHTELRCTVNHTSDKIWVSLPTLMLDLVLWNLPRNFAASCTVALSAAKAVHCTSENHRARHFVGSLLCNHVWRLLWRTESLLSFKNRWYINSPLYIYICFAEHCPRSLNWNYSPTRLLLVATYLYVEENFYIVYTLLNLCKAETEMLLGFSYLLIIQGELCRLD